MYSVYAIYSKKHNRLYVGMSANVVRRLQEHNHGEVKSTKYFLPWVLVYEEVVGERPEARKKEKYFKSGCGKEYLKQFILR